MKRSSLIAAIGIAVAIYSSSAQDHGHLNVGAVGINQNDPLNFDNGGDFAASNRYVKTLTFTNGGTYAGFYQANLTLTALAATSGHAGPVPNAPALGSYIHVQLGSVDGPAGGSFAFWETGATSPSISLPSGSTGTNIWRLSENGGVAGTDPFGHIHGRRFTATKPGVYTVKLRAVDLSTNGIGGGPIHNPSGEFTMCFQAGDCVRSVKPDAGGARIQFGARTGYTWQVQAASSLVADDWAVIGDPITGDDYFHEVVDPDSSPGSRFYRTTGTEILE